VRRFGLIGAAGYVAPKHLKAIKDIGGQLIAAYDPRDSVGVLDQYFPDADFFTEFERFDRHLDRLKRLNEALDCIIVCSPNYLHDAHIRFGLKSGCHVICEKPLVLNPWNLKSLIELESESNKKVHCVYQLRNHPEILKLKERIDQFLSDDYHQVELKYVTPRGKWYDYSWKGMEEKSGGITSNIGVHLFDLLIWIFGEVLEKKLFERTSRKAEGFLKLKRAEINWKLSINK
jgi:UDP-N-acetyl-2-amino-2-deoxyglucuronate dehydrogenase